MEGYDQLFLIIGKQAVTIDSLQRQLSCLQKDLQHLQESSNAKQPDRELKSDEGAGE